MGKIHECGLLQRTSHGVISHYGCILCMIRLHVELLIKSEISQQLHGVKFNTDIHFMDPVTLHDFLCHKITAVSQYYMTC